MTTIGGNDITLTASQIVGAIGTFIIRTPTADSNDTLDTAVNLITTAFGENTTDFNGSSFSIDIYNNSNFSITINPSTGTTLSPESPGVILSGAIHTYIFIQTAPSTLIGYLSSIGSSSSNPNLSIPDGNILIGDSGGIATSVPITGDATINNSGILTLDNTTVTPGTYTSANITIDSKGRITTANNGSGSGVPGGVNTNIQYNDSGSFGGSANLTWDNINNNLTLTGKQIFSNFTNSGTPSTTGSQIEIQSTNFEDTTGGPTTPFASFISIDQPILTASAPTVTNQASTLHIFGAPIAGANQTITDSISLQVDSGLINFGGLTNINNSLSVSNTISGSTVTDGFFSTTSGAVTGVITLDASGTITGGTISDGTATFTGGSITGLISPTIGSEAANKAYVDSIAVGLTFKEPVRVTTTTLLSSLNGEQTIDGISTVSGDRVLVKDGTSTNPNVDGASIDNGIYVVAIGAWSRSTDLPNGVNAAGDALFIEEGTLYSASGFVCNNISGSDLVGTDPLSFVQFSGAGQLSSGLGIQIVGNTISTDVDNSTIGYSGNSMIVKNLGIDTAQISNDAVTTIKISDGNVTNVKLANDSITITAGDGLQNGGTLALGGSITINVDSTVLRTIGDQFASGVNSFTNTTASTDPTTGAVVISGGLGVQGDVYTSGKIDTSGTIEGSTLTDGTLSSTSGVVTGAVSIATGSLTATGTVQGGTVTDGTFTTTDGIITGVVSLNASGTITGGSITDGTATLQSGTLTGLVAPTNDSDAANKAYVDSLVQGLQFKDPVRLGTTGDLAGATYNGSPTSPNTITSAPTTIDGISIAQGDRILVKDGIAGSGDSSIPNGIYVVTATTTTWERATDMSAGTDSQNFTVLIEEGTVNANSGFTVTGVSPYIVDTDAIDWTQYSSGGSVNAGIALDKSGNTLNVKFDDVTIGVATNELFVKDGGVDTLQLATDSVTTAKITDANVTNSKLANDSVTITAGDGLQNGGSVALGSSVTIDVDSTVLRTTGNQAASGIQSFTNSTSSIDPNTGAVVITGGLGVGENINASGTIQGSTLTDGTLTSTSGVITGAISIGTGSLTATGTVQGLTLTDGAGSTISSGDITANGITASTDLTTSYIPPNRILFTTTGGLVTSDAGFEYNGTSLTITDIDTQTITRPNDLNLASLWSDGSGNIDIGLNSTGTIQIGSGPGMKLTQTGSTIKAPLTIQDNFSRRYNTSIITTTSNVTYTASQFYDGLIRRDPNGVNRVDTTPTAADLVNIVYDRVVGSSIEVLFENTADALELVTIQPGTGVTIQTVDNEITIENGITTRFLVVFTNITPGLETVSIYAAVPRDRIVVQGSISEPNAGPTFHYANWGPQVAVTVVDGFVLGYSGRIVQVFASYSNDVPISMNQAADALNFSIGTSNSTLDTFTPYTGGTDVIVFSNLLGDDGTYPAKTSGLLDIPISSTDRLALRSEEVNSVAPTSGVEIRLAVTIELD